MAVGTPLITIGESGNGDVTAAASAQETTQEQPEPMLVGYGAPRATSARPARRKRAAQGAGGAVTSVVAVRPETNHDEAQPAAPVDASTRPRSTPPVRVYARQRGVDLTMLSRELHGRTITRGDVDAFLTNESPGAPAPHGAAASLEGDGVRGETRIPVRGVRKQTAIAMEQSAFTAPQVTVFHTIDITETMSLLARLKRDSVTSHPIGLLALVSKAVCLALQEVPEVNSSWAEQTGEIVQYQHVDLGIAVATDRGLIVPHIRNAHALTLEALAQELKELATTGREGKTPLDRLTGGTFSITNIGVFGVDSGSPLLPPGQSGILAVGAVRRQPWEHEGEVKLREVLTLSLTIDHRVIDGAEGARYLKAVGDLLVHPANAFLHA